MKKAIISVIIIIIIGFIIYLLVKSPVEVVEEVVEEVKTEENTEEVVEEDKTKTVIGSSVNGNEITAFHYGTGQKNLLFVGGIHGGYDWNVVLMAYQLMDLLEKNPEIVPENIRVTIIPVLNPDGLEQTLGTTGVFTSADAPATEELVAGRFNANNVDLNRNFDCDWQDSGVWQSKTVSGGTAPFSEPESQALRSIVESTNPSAVVIWYSAAGGVYTSNCHNGVLPETTELTKIFAEASGYSANEDFDFYEVTGDAVNWLAKENIPAISVLLTNHKDVELDKNLNGVKAILDYYAE